MDPAALKFLLDEINRRFDEADARVNRLFDKLQQPAHLLGSLPSASFDLPATPLSVDHFSDASASVPATPAAAVEAVVIVDNWGGCFDDREQYCTAPSVVADNWGGFFGGEDLDLPGSTSFPCNSESGAVPTKALVTSTDPDAPLGSGADSIPTHVGEGALEPGHGDVAVGGLVELGAVPVPVEATTRRRTPTLSFAGNYSQHALTIWRPSFMQQIRFDAHTPLREAWEIDAHMQSAVRGPGAFNVYGRAGEHPAPWTDPPGPLDRAPAVGTFQIELQQQAQVRSDQSASRTSGRGEALESRADQDVCEDRPHDAQTSAVEEAMAAGAGDPGQLDQLLLLDPYAEDDITNYCVEFHNAVVITIYSSIIIKPETGSSSSSSFACSTKCPSQALHNIGKPSLVAVVTIAGTPSSTLIDAQVVLGEMQPREHSTLMTATIELRFILWYFFILYLVALQQSPPWPQPVKSLVVVEYILPKPPWLAFDLGNLFRIHYTCSTRSASLQYTLQLSPDVGNIQNQCLDLCLVNLITGSALNVMVQQLLVSVGSPSNALVLKIPIQGVVDALHRKTLQGTGLNEEQMRQASVADNGHRQLNKIIVDLDQDNITAKNYAIAFYTEKHIQIPCLGGEHEVTFFHEYRDSVERVFVDHPSYHRPGNLYGAKVVLLGFQHYPVMLGTTVIIPTALVPQMGGKYEDKVVVIQTLMFVVGMNTLRQSFLGTRLPAVTGGSYAFVMYTISIILGGRSANEPSSHIKFLGIMRGTHGALIVASALQIIVAFSGLWCNVARYLSSLSATPLVALVVFGLYELEIPRAGKIKALSVDAVIVFGSQRIPQVIHSVMWIMFILFRVIGCLQFSWDPGGSNWWK
jgi:hypothetical protein